MVTLEIFGCFFFGVFIIGCIFAFIERKKRKKAREFGKWAAELEGDANVMAVPGYPKVSVPEEKTSETESLEKILLLEEVDLKKPMIDVRPRDIDTKNVVYWLSVFGKAEIEWAAQRLVAFFQKRNLWHGFTIQDLLDFYRDQGIKDHSGPLYGLFGSWIDDGTLGLCTVSRPLVVHGPNGLYYVTNLFVDVVARRDKDTKFYDLLGLEHGPGDMFDPDGDRYE